MRFYYDWMSYETEFKERKSTGGETKAVLGFFMPCSHCFPALQKKCNWFRRIKTKPAMEFYFILISTLATLQSSCPNFCPSSPSYSRILRVRPTRFSWRSNTPSHPHAPPHYPTSVFMQNMCRDFNKWKRSSTTASYLFLILMWFSCIV